MNLDRIRSVRAIRNVTLAAIASFMLATPALAQQQGGGSYQPGYKDPGTATLFGVLLTGGGQMYAGETKKGVMLLGIGLGSLVAGAAMSTSDCGYYGSCSVNTAPLLLGSLAYLGTWVYGIADAGSAARRQNAIRGFATNGTTPTLKHFANGRVGLGLSFSIAP